VLFCAQTLTRPDRLDKNDVATGCKSRRKAVFACLEIGNAVGSTDDTAHPGPYEWRQLLGALPFAYLRRQALPSGKSQIGARLESGFAHTMKTTLAPLLLTAVTAAQSGVAPLPSASYAQEVPLWPAESKVLMDGIEALAKEDWALTHPSFLLYPSRQNPPGAAVLVFPGGGYKALAIGPRSTIGPLGADVCQWMNEMGVTCILVKYRVPHTGCHWNPVTRRHEQPEVPMALQDAQRAISMVRYYADDYGIDPTRIGVMGFSAGGNLAVLSSTNFGTRAYEPIDAIDQVSSRPDFAIPVYPGHLTMEHKNKTPRAVAARELNSDIVVSSEVPPTLLIHAKDDPVDPVHYSMVYEEALKQAGAPVELIIYGTGGHGFGVRKQGKDTDRWMEDAIRWLSRIDVLEASATKSDTAETGAMPIDSVEE
jgi:acetyl esterase/lipase